MDSDRSIRGHSLRELERQITEDPIKAARRCQKLLTEVEAGFHTELYVLLSLAYRMANHFVSDKDAWEEFTKDPFWGKCSRKKPTLEDSNKDIFLWVSRYFFKATKTDEPRYNRAYKHSRTLYRYFRDKVPVDEVADKLAKEGADYAFVLETEEHPRQPKGGKSTTRAQTAKVKGSDNSVSASSKPGTQARSERQDKVPPLSVEMTLAHLCQILDLPVGGKAQITVTREESESDRKRIVATGVKVLED